MGIDVTIVLYNGEGRVMALNTLADSMFWGFRNLVHFNVSFSYMHIWVKEIVDEKRLVFLTMISVTVSHIPGCYWVFLLGNTQE